MKFIFTYMPETKPNDLNHLAQLSPIRQCEVEDVDMNAAIRKFRKDYGQAKIVNSFVHPGYHLEYK